MAEFDIRQGDLIILTRRRIHITKVDGVDTEVAENTEFAAVRSPEGFVITGGTVEPEFIEGANEMADRRYLVARLVIR